MRREEHLERAIRNAHDVVIVGGGATGLGLALDAAARGFKTVLLEACDFGKGTSSRSTKLIHGGLRYLRQGNIRLIREASVERGLLLRLAPHLVRPLEFFLPAGNFFERIEYWLGLELYESLAGHYRIGPVRTLGAAEIGAEFPTLASRHRRRGYLYWDAQFDDARYLVHLCRTAVKYGAVVLNYARVISIHRGVDGRVDAVTFEDVETGERHDVRTSVVINATGPFADDVRRMVEPTGEGLILPSRGSHLVLRQDVWPSSRALIVPRTPDGRVLFLIPWHGRLLAGTTDVSVPRPELEPTPSVEEVEFILTTLAQYLDRPVGREDVLASFAGIRPLVNPRFGRGGQSTADVPRDHFVLISRTGLVTITGGKWTTYRWMAEDCLNRIIKRGMLDDRPCRTRSIRLDGYVPAHPQDGVRPWEGLYAARKAALIRKDPELGKVIDPRAGLRLVDVLWAVQHEMARTVEDVLCRRTRLFFLDTRLARECARPVAQYMATLLGRSTEWVERECRGFERLCDVALAPVDACFSEAHSRTAR